MRATSMSHVLRFCLPVYIKSAHVLARNVYSFYSFTQSGTLRFVRCITTVVSPSKPNPSCRAIDPASPNTSPSPGEVPAKLLAFIRRRQATRFTMFSWEPQRTGPEGAADVGESMYFPGYQACFNGVYQTRAN